MSAATPLSDATPSDATPPARSARDMARSAAPLITMGATVVVRKGMIKGYESRTGKKAPLVRSRDAHLLEKVLWAAAMSAMLVLVEGIVWKVLGEED